eukprot:354031-Chlamydomonas_euryale.AAC.7
MVCWQSVQPWSAGMSARPWANYHPLHAPQLKPIQIAPVSSTPQSLCQHELPLPLAYPAFQSTKSAPAPVSHPTPTRTVPLPTPARLQHAARVKALDA